VTRPRKSEPPRTTPPARKRRRVRFDIDRVTLLRAAFVVVVVLSLYIILRVSMHAVGGSAAREVKQIERAIDGPVTQQPAPAGATKAKDRTAQ
jgi:hypothetical protein